MKINYLQSIQDLTNKILYDDYENGTSEYSFIYELLFQTMQELEIIEKGVYFADEYRIRNNYVAGHDSFSKYYENTNYITRIESLLIEFMWQIKDRISKEKMDAFPTELFYSLEQLIFAIFPEGRNLNESLYFNQTVDYHFPTESFPSLLALRVHQSSCILELIKLTIKSNHLKIALEIYKRNHTPLRISPVSFLGYVNNLICNTFLELENTFEEENQEKSPVNPQEIFEKINVSLYDLYYIKDLMLEFPLLYDELKAKSVRAVGRLLELLNELQKIIGETFIDLRNLDYSLENIECFLVSYFTEDTTTRVKYNARPDKEVYSRIQFLLLFSNISVDRYHNYEKKSVLVELTEEEKKSFEVLAKTKEICEEINYLHSLIDREYLCLMIVDNYHQQLSSSLEYVNKLIECAEKEEEEKLLNEISNISEEEKRDLVIRFLKCCEECQDSSYGKPYTSYKYEKINYNSLYAKIKNNSTIIDILAASQKRFEKFENLNVFGGDFTFMVVNQIKVVERYLKEIIVQHLVGTQIYSSYKNKNTLFDNAKQRKIYEENNGTSYIVVKPNSGIEVLCISNPNKSISIQLATCMHIVSNFFEELRDDSTIEHLDSTFNDKNQAIPTLNTWKSTVRNGYFHVHLVESTKDAIVVHNKTAFCLMRCIFELKGLKR